ncbi:MarR family transcriptional regulator [Streptomyces phaeolivaceus]|uniref:MarR family transcriptional regulator n=1 Tax=Streptomyces phaeolivaceus TaxID=2653200 RepID=A0A5P8K7Z7_9ACTN|nr:MarR family transcriptional regulator [Streptomyces phaeolivaceus]QFQ99126.1 MarR family transcriptional regulator [Streptomyces phaeolivaceus]
MADDDEEAHDGGEETGVDADAPGGQGAEGVVEDRADQGEQLKISPAAVSGAVRYLAQVHLVSREREPGSRRERYRVHSDQWYEALTNREAIIKRWEEALREGVTSLGADSPAGRRLSETLAFFEFVETEVEEMMGRWRVRRDEMFGRD